MIDIFQEFCLSEEEKSRIKKRSLKSCKSNCIKEGSKLFPWHYLLFMMLLLVNYLLGRAAKECSGIQRACIRGPGAEKGLTCIKNT